MKTKNTKLNQEDSRYTYVILRRGPRPQIRARTSLITTREGERIPRIDAIENLAYHWPRLILPPMKRKGHVVIDACLPRVNEIERFIIPKSQGLIPYRDAKKVMWGDLFPHPSKKPGTKRLGVNTKPTFMPLDEFMMDDEANLSAIMQIPEKSQEKFKPLGEFVMDDNEKTVLLPHMLDPQIPEKKLKKRLGRRERSARKKRNSIGAERLQLIAD